MEEILGEEPQKPWIHGVKKDDIPLGDLLALKLNWRSYW